MKNTEYVTRWVVTIPSKDMKGFRTLALPCQGRHTYETEDGANEWIKAYLENGNRDILGDDLKAMPCPCYPGHFDPARVWFREGGE
jgi:hypothetical protein